MNELKEVVEQKVGQPWKVEKQFDDFTSADVARKNLLADSKNGMQVKVKFLPSLNKFVLKTRKHEVVVEDKTSKKTKKNLSSYTGT